MAATLGKNLRPPVPNWSDDYASTQTQDCRQHMKRSGLLISMLGKLSWFRFTGLITVVLLMRKWMGLFLRKNLLRCWGWPSLLNWIWALTFSLLIKLPPRKLEPYIVSWSFFLLEFKKYSDFCKTACWLRFCSLMKLMLLSRFWTQN